MMPPPVSFRTLSVLYEDSAVPGVVTLRDGSTARVRLAGPEDQAVLAEFFAQLSPESRRRRFLSPALPTAEQIAGWCREADPRAGATLLAIDPRGAQPVLAVGTFQITDAPGPGRTAEVALVVDDTVQGKGLGTLLLERMALLAVRRGFTRFSAIVQTDNTAMREVFRDSGFAVTERPERGQVEVDLILTPSESTVARLEMRHRVATVASLRPFFNPETVAVIGVSRDPASIGFRLLAALVQGGFTGRIYPVNPKAAELQGLKAYPSVRDLPEAIDLAVIAVPRDAVFGVIEDCAARGIRALVVITAGFAEVGAAGTDPQRLLVELIHRHGLRLIGPNCLGLLSTDPEVRLNATFVPGMPPPGKLAMSSDSGALGLAVLATATRLGLGVSTCVSVGNRADVSSNDLLEYWEDDPGTDAILLYLESFGNPRRFARLARRISRRKPIVVVKAGRTSAGSRAAGSHTAALAARDVAVDALFHQTGVLRAETLEELFDLAAVLTTQPLPPGRRVAILTNAGGPAILCADACEGAGLSVVELTAATRAKLAEFLPAAASLGNPVDMIASASPASFGRAVQTLLQADEVDALIVIHATVGVPEDPAVIQAVREGTAAARGTGKVGKPVLVCLMPDQSGVSLLGTGPDRLPCYPFPEAAARALGKLAGYAAWRTQPPGRIPDLEADPATARAVCREALEQRGAGWLSAEEMRRVLQAARLPVALGGVAHTADEAIRLAREAGFPVAVKLASTRLVHKTEVGGVHLGLADEAAVRRAFEAIRTRLTSSNMLDAFEGVVVQPMVAGGTEVMIGMTLDPLFGPLLAFGLGGIHVEILGDVCFRVGPLTDHDATEMVRGIRGYRLLTGYRGHAPADIPALEEALLRISRLVEEVPEIAEIDLNPLFALPPGQGCRIVDARIRVEAVRKRAGA